MTCDIACTALTGYLPTALSPESITASVPSITAFATSETSARVGIGLWIIDSIICVAVITTRLRLRVAAMMCFCRPGQLGVTDFDAEIAARDHHCVARLDDAIEIHERLAALDLGDEVAVAALLAQQLARLVHVGAVARERDGQVVDAELGGELDVGAILVGQRAGRQPAALLVDALVVGQLTADRRRACRCAARSRRCTSSTICPSLSSSVSPARTSFGRLL